MSELGGPDCSEKRLLIFPQQRTSRINAVTSEKCQQETHAPQQFECYSITSSAWASNDAGTTRPSAFAVLRLMTNSNLVGSRTGKSAGFSPLRMRPTCGVVEARR